MMGYNNNQGYHQKYARTAVESEIEGATPHRLVQMLMEGVLEKIATAKGYMMRRQFETTSRHINWAISIVNGLRTSLNKEAGGDLARNLDELYDYMSRRLVQANINADPAMLDEVAALMAEVKSGWNQVPALLERDMRKETTGVSADAVR